MEQIIDEIIKTSSEDIGTNVSNEDKKDWENLVIAAENTKKELERLQRESESVLRQMALNSNLTRIDLETDKAVLLTRLTYQTIEQNFQKQFDKFISNEKQRKVIYVYQDENNKLELYELDMNQIFAKAGAAGTVGADSIKRLLFKYSKVTPMKNFSKNKLSRSNAAWSGVYNRLQRFSEVNNVELSSLKSGLLMWKVGHEWIIFNVNNWGDVKEAYVASLFDETHDLPSAKGGGKYRPHALIEDFALKYISNVTNMGALLEEDISLKFIDYAVKSSGFSLPNFGQYYQAIGKILAISKSYNNMTYMEIRNELINTFNRSAARNKILGKVEDYKDKKKDEILEEIKESLKKK